MWPGLRASQILLRTAVGRMWIGTQPTLRGLNCETSSNTNLNEIQLNLSSPNLKEIK